jgi:undecaprenyl-diphosphatase
LDFSIYKALNGLAVGHDGLEDVFRFFALEAELLFIVLLASLFFAAGKWRSANGRHGVVAAGFSALLALGIAQLIADVVQRPRPYVTHPGEAHLFIPASPDYSFPSDHSTAAFAIAVAIWLRHRRAGWLALAMAATVSLSRVIVGTHYPGDVLAGAVLGATAALVLWLPPMRGLLHRTAEWAGSVYDGLLGSLLRRRSHSAAT